MAADLSSMFFYLFFVVALGVVLYKVGALMSLGKSKEADGFEEINRLKLSFLSWIVYFLSYGVCFSIMILNYGVAVFRVLFSLLGWFAGLVTLFLFVDVLVFVARRASKPLKKRNALREYYG